MKLLYIGLGGAVGSILRYSLSGVAQRFGDASFPTGTLAVNIIGCFAIGILYEMFERSLITESMRAFAMIGLLGGLTTFSTFGLESVNLLRDGEQKLAVINIVGTNLLCITALFVGLFLARYLFGR